MLKKIILIFCLLIFLMGVSHAAALSVYIYGGDKTIDIGTTISFSASVTGGVTPYSYEWSVGTVLSYSSKFSYRFDSPGTYYVDLWVECGSGNDWDFASDTVMIKVEDPRDTTPPADPKPIHTDLEKLGNADNDTTLDFSWTAYDAGSGIKTTSIWIARDGVYGNLYDWSFNPPACQIEKAEEGRSYKIKVKLSDKEGNARIGESASIVVDTIYPNIQLIEPKNDKTLSGTCNIQYSANDNRGIHKKEIKATKGKTSDSAWETAPDDGEAMLTITVWDEAGNKASTSKSYTLFNPPPVPQELKVVKAENGKVLLEWKTPYALTDLREYAIYRKEENDFIKVGATKNLSYEDANVIDGSKYYYKVKAIDDSGSESDFSNEVSATPKDTLAPAAPVIDSNGCWVGNGWVILVWDKVTQNADGSFLKDLAGYNVYYKLENEPDSSYKKANTALISKDSSPKPFYKVTSLKNFHKYVFKAAAQDLSQNESPISKVQKLVPIPHAVIQEVISPSGMIVKDTDVIIDPSKAEKIMLRYFTGMKTDWVKIRIKKVDTNEIVYEYKDFDVHLYMQSDVVINTLPIAYWDGKSFLINGSQGEIVPPGEYKAEIEAGRYDAMPGSSGLTAMGTSALASSSIGQWIEVWQHNIKVNWFGYDKLGITLAAEPSQIFSNGGIATIKVKLKAPQGVEVKGMKVKFTSDKGQMLDTEVITNYLGEGSARFKSGKEGGSATITGKVGWTLSQKSETVKVTMIELGAMSISPSAEAPDLYNKNFYAGLGERKFEAELKDKAGNPLKDVMIEWLNIGASGKFQNSNISKTNEQGKAFIYFKVDSNTSNKTLEIKARVKGTEKEASTGNLAVIFNSDATIFDIENGNKLLTYDFGNQEANVMKEIKEMLNQVVPRKKSITSYKMLDETGSFKEDTEAAVRSFVEGFGFRNTFLEEDTAFNEMKKQYPNLTDSHRYRIIGRETIRELKSKRLEVDKFINAFLTEADRYANCPTRWVHDPSENPKYPIEGSPGEAYLLGGGTVLDKFVEKLKANKVGPGTISEYSSYEVGYRPETDIGIDCSGFVQACANAAKIPFIIVPNLSKGASSKIGTWNIYNEIIFKFLSPSSNEISKRLRRGDIIIIPGKHVVILWENPKEDKTDTEFIVINAYGNTPIGKLFSNKVIKMFFTEWVSGKTQKPIPLTYFTYGRMKIWE